MNQIGIARKLKVSQTTVSLVLNNPSTTKVSPEKRHKIMELMRKTSYLLKAHNGRTWNIGYVVETGINVQDSFYHRFFDGIQKASEEAGYHVIVDQENIRASRLISHNKADGIILEDNFSDIGGIKNLSREIPLVLLNCSPMALLCDMVVPDNQGGIIKAINHLIGLGHSKIALLAVLAPGCKLDGLSRDRKEAFENESKLMGLAISHDYIKIPAIKAVSIEETDKVISATLSFWMKLPEPPTAVICCGDIYAALLLRAAAEKNIKVPGQLSVIGTDNTNECKYTYPALTSIDHNAAEMGRLAVELLLKRISNPERAYVRISCDATLAIRKSTGPLLPISPQT